VKRAVAIFVFILTLLFTAVLPGRQKQEYAQIEFDDDFRTLHIHIAGEPKTGKTRLGAWIGYHDTLQGLPFVAIDGNGGLTNDIISLYLKNGSLEVLPRIVLISFESDLVHCLPLFDYSQNLKPSEYADHLAEVIYRITEGYKGVAYRMQEQIQKSTTLVCHAAQISGIPFQISEVSRFFDTPTYHDFRHKVYGITRREYADVVRFYEHVWEKLSPTKQYDEIGSFLNKLSPFLVDYHLRATVAGGTPTINFQQVEDQRLIVLFDLSALTDPGKEIMTSLLIQKLKNHIFGNAGRKVPFVIMIDELHSILQFEGIRADIQAFQSRARAFNLWFTVIHQNMHQLDPEVRATLWSMGTQFVMRQNNFNDAVDTVQNLLDYVPEAYKEVGAHEREFVVPPNEQVIREANRLQSAPNRVGVFKRHVKSYDFRRRLVEDRRVGEWAKVPNISTDGVSEDDVKMVKQFSLRRWGRPIDEVLEEIDGRINQFMKVRIGKKERKKERI
jgi:hypothetical protein